MRFQVSTAHQLRPNPRLGRFRGVKILLVEDHEESRNTLASLLVRDGHATTTAGTVAEGLEALWQKRIDVLICDLGLPDGDGLEVVAKAKQVNPYVKAIALTGARQTTITKWDSRPGSIIT
jgi:CheY-like chemotaxis protein